MANAWSILGHHGFGGTADAASMYFGLTGSAEPVIRCEHGGGHEWPNFAGAEIRNFVLSF